MTGSRKFSDPLVRRLNTLDKKFLAWIRTQPSVHRTGFNEYRGGVGQNIACHVRGAYNAGWGMKPIFSAVPMRHKEHENQYKIQPLEWYREEAKVYVERWLKTIAPADAQIVRDYLAIA